MGEKILSFRSLLKVFRIQRFTTNMPADRTTSVIPTAINFTYWDSVLLLNLGTSLGDLYDTLGACFLYSRGGMRLKFDTRYLSTTQNAIASSQEFETSAPNYITRGASVNVVADPWTQYNLSSGRMNFNDCQNDGMLEIQTPQYTLRHSRNNIAEMVNPLATHHYSTRANLAASQCVNVNTSYFYLAGVGVQQFAFPMYRATADDFSFHEFVSTVPIQRLNGTTYL
jgi:hypothetical protein